MSETEVTYQGLIHQCDDPDCHVVGFVKTLEQEPIGVVDF